MKVVVNSTAKPRKPLAAVSVDGKLIWIGSQNRGLTVISKFAFGVSCAASERKSLEEVIDRGATPVYEGDSVTIQF